MLIVTEHRVGQGSSGASVLEMGQARDRKVLMFQPRNIPTPLLHSRTQQSLELLQLTIVTPIFVNEFINNKAKQ